TIRLPTRPPSYHRTKLSRRILGQFDLWAPDELGRSATDAPAIVDLGWNRHRHNHRSVWWMDLGATPSSISTFRRKDCDERSADIALPQSEFSQLSLDIIPEASLS